MRSWETVWRKEIEGNFQIAEYCEMLVCTSEGEFRLIHHGGSLGIIPANVKKMSKKKAHAFFKRLFPRRSWKVTTKEIDKWIESKRVREVNL